MDKIRYGCYCDLEPEDDPMKCVVDDSNYTIEDCIYAIRGIKKEDCGFWRPVQYKIYIVGAVSGVENWKDKFLKAKQQMANRGHTNVRTPINYPEGLTQKEYMVLSCESVFWADVIVVTKGWENSKGTKAEIALAESFGCEVMYL